MTDNHGAGDHAPHVSSAQVPSDYGLSLRVGLSVSGSLTMDAGLDAHPASPLGPVPPAGVAGPAGSRKPGRAVSAGAARGGKKPKASPRRERARRRAASRARMASRARPSSLSATPPAGTQGGPSSMASGTAGSPEQVVKVGSPASLLALIPHLMGFEPRMSVVLLGAEPPHGRVRVTLRFDLPKTPDLALADEVARHGLSVLTAQGFRTVVAVGYGPGRLVTPFADAIRHHAAGTGVRLLELLRAEDGRYWSYLCAEPGCCSPDGVPYDVAADPVTAAFAAAGAPPVLTGRAELVASVAGVDGPAGRAMSEATRRAEDRAASLVARAAASSGKGAGRRLIASAGLESVRDAIEAYRAGGELASDDEAAWLLVALRDLRVRDDAWARMDPEHTQAHLQLWTDLTRRARPGLVAAPASLLAFVAWQSGNGALANIALDRVLGDNPGYSMARLLREVVDAGIPPQRARLPMTPEEVAESYARAEREGYGDADFGDPGYDDYDDYELGDDEDDYLDEDDFDDDEGPGDEDGPSAGAVPGGGPGQPGGSAGAGEQGDRALSVPA